MIELLTGVPGSGKTYFAVERLSREYVKKSRPIFTNINLLIPYDDILQPLDIADFHDFCKRELAFFGQFRESQSIKLKEDGNNDDPQNYDDELKKSGLLEKYGNALILWDECHNDLGDVDDAYLRWMSYHRHFDGMDVLLITQNLSLIARKYKGFIDKYYFGVNAAKRIFSTTFKYKVYTDHRQYEKFLVEEISLPSDKRIFALYDSGFYKVNKSVLFKKLAAPAAILLFLILFLKYFFFGYMMHRNDPPVSSDLYDPNSVPLTQEQIDLRQSVKELNEAEQIANEQAINDSQMLPPPPLQPYQSGNPSAQIQPYQQDSFNRQNLSRFFVRFNCTREYCYFPGNRMTIPLGSVNSFMKEFNAKILTLENVNSDISTVTALVPADLYYMIQSHNIQSRSDNYGFQSRNQNSNFMGGDPLSAPQFVPNQGI